MGLLKDTIAKIGPLDERAMKAARERQDTLTKPLGSLGVLEDLSVRIAGITGNAKPVITKKAVITMAGDHGVVSSGVSLYPQEVTVQMVHNFVQGGAGINVLAKLVGARVVVVDMGVNADLALGRRVVSSKIGRGTNDMTKGPAMTRDQATRAIEAGIRVVQREVAKGVSLVGTGDMGIGNTTPSSAICACLTGKAPREVTGRGTGLADAQLASKAKVIELALSVNNPNPCDSVDVLAKVGGFEIAGIAGVILGATANRVPVVIDGFISGAGAMIAAGIEPRVRDYVIAAHLSVEPGHRAMMEYLKARPLVDLNMRLGEGTGGCIGIFLCEAATRILSDMATFDSAGVSTAEGG